MVGVPHRRRLPSLPTQVATRGSAIGVGVWGFEVKRFRGGLVFQAHRLLDHSAVGLRVKKKKKKLWCSGMFGGYGWFRARRDSPED
jgi:hypothetical protein